jgi:DNA-binding LacI/PurR family transcriptional regulator
MEYTRFINENELSSHIGLVRGKDENAAPEDFDRLVNQWKEMKGDLAVICYYDELALRFITSLHKHGLSIPDDIAVLGYNNQPEGNFSDPPLSTVECPYDFIAEAMVNHAIALSIGESAQMAEKHVPEFVIRESCGGKTRAGKTLDGILKGLK